jgi:hypothetical protein
MTILEDAAALGGAASGLTLPVGARSMLLLNWGIWLMVSSVAAAQDVYESVRTTCTDTESQLW